MIGLMRRGVQLGVVLNPDRLSIGVARGGKVSETFSIVDAEHPADALRAELEARGLRPGAARLAIHRGFAVVKALTLPAGVGGDLAQMVRFDLERHVPFAAEDAAFDFVPLVSEGEGQRVLVVASERRVVERALEPLGARTIRPLALTVAAHDLVPLLNRRPRGEQAVWSHRSGDAADLLFLVGNTLVLSRSVPATDAAMLAAEIRGSLAMLRWSECQALWMSGDDGERVPDSPALAALGIPIGAPPLSDRARRALGAITTVSDGVSLLAAAVAIGPRFPQLNLLPASLRPRRLSRAQKVTVAMAAVTACLGITALLAPGVRDQRELRRLEADIRRLDPEVRAIERIMAELERDRRLLEAVQAASVASLHPLPLMRELTELLPTDVWLTALTMDLKGAELTGQAASASALVPLLENSPRLERVEFASPVTRGRDKEQFRIRAAWEATPAVAATPAQAARDGLRKPVR
jgi:general secretion pathway protein L